MEQILNTIPAEELFGTASQLVEQGGEHTLSGIASLGAMYQATTGMVALLFIFRCIRFFEIFRYLTLSLVSNKVSRSNIHIYSSEIKNIEILTSIIGIVLIALMTMRLSVTEGVDTTIARLGELSAWKLGGITLCGIVLMMGAERIALYFCGIASERNDACNQIWQTKMLHFSTSIILLSPTVILTLLTDGLVAKIALYCSVTICLASLILFIKETFLLFRAQRFSIFHWILYLCALEIFPLSLLLAPILRG